MCSCSRCLTCCRKLSRDQRIRRNRCSCNSKYVDGSKVWSEDLASPVNTSPLIIKAEKIQKIKGEDGSVSRIDQFALKICFQFDSRIYNSATSNFYSLKLKKSILIQFVFVKYKKFNSYSNIGNSLKNILQKYNINSAWKMQNLIDIITLCFW